MLVLLVDFCLRYITYYVNRHSFQNFRGKKTSKTRFAGIALSTREFVCSKIDPELPVMSIPPDIELEMSTR